MKSVLFIVTSLFAFYVIMRLWQTGYDWWVGNRAQGLSNIEGGAKSFWIALFLANCVYAISRNL